MISKNSENKSQKSEFFFFNIPLRLGKMLRILFFQKFRLQHFKILKQSFKCTDLLSEKFTLHQNLVLS